MFLKISTTQMVVLDLFSCWIVMVSDSLFYHFGNCFLLSNRDKAKSLTTDVFSDKDNLPLSKENRIQTVGIWEITILQPFCLVVWKYNSTKSTVTKELILLYFGRIAVRKVL